MISLLLHVAVTTPVIGVAVLSGERPSSPPSPITALADTSTRPLEEHQPLVTDFEPYTRHEHRQSEVTSPVDPIVWRHTPIGHDVRVLDDPLRHAGLGHRFAPRRVSGAGDGRAEDHGDAKGSGDDGGSTGDDVGVVSESGAATRRRESVVTDPVKLTDSFDPDRDYPRRERRRGREGVVRVRVLVGVDGSVVDVCVVEEGTRASTSFIAKAKVVARRCTYRPGTRDGTPIERWSKAFDIRFSLDDL